MPQLQAIPTVSDNALIICEKGGHRHMSAPADKSYFASLHSWTDAIHSFSHNSIHAFVIQISDETHALAKLRMAVERMNVPNQRLAFADLIHDICSHLILIDATPGFLFAIGKKNLYAATIQFRREMVALTVKKGLGFLTGLLSGSATGNLIMNGPMGLPNLNLTVHARSSDENVLKILLSAHGNTELLPLLSVETALSNVIDSSADFIFMVALNGKVSFMNQGMREIFGKKDIDRPLEIPEILAPDSANRFGQITTLITQKDEPWCGVLEFVHPDSSDFIAVSGQIRLVRDSIQQQVIGYCCTCFKNVENNPLSSLSCQNLEEEWEEI